MHGFNIGADDYIPKPFTFREVEARLQSILRRISWITEKPLAKNLRFLGVASYQLNFQRSRDRRVPMSADDLLPDASQKHNLSEDPGDIFALTGGLIWDLGTYWSITGAYQFEQKFEGQISGAPSGRAQYLESGSDREAHLARVETTFSTAKAYRLGQSSVPWSIYYEWVSVFSGKNVESSILHEVGLSLYF